MPKVIILKKETALIHIYVVYQISNINATFVPSLSVVFVPWPTLYI